LFGLARAARVPLTLVTASAALGGIATVAQMVVASHLVASVFPTRTTAAVIGRALFVLLVLIGARAAFAALTERYSQRLATRIKSSLRQALVAHIVDRGPRRRVGEQTGELVTTTMEGVERLDAFYRRFVPQTIATSIVPMVVLAAVAWLDPTSAVILGLTGPLILLFMWLLGTLAAQRTREQWLTLGRLGGRFLDTLQGLPTLTMFGRQHDAAAALVAASDEFRVRTMGVLRAAFLSGFVLELAASLSTALVAAGIGIRLIEGWMTFETGLAVLLLTPEFYLPFRQLGQRHHAGMEGVAAAERIFAVLDEPADRSQPSLVNAGEGCRAVARSGLQASEGGRRPLTLTFEHVTFQYPDTDRPAVDDVSFDLQPGTMTAIVGPSGAGKSTIVGLTLRFLEPCTGRLRCDGGPLLAVDPATWRASLAHVPQAPRFFEGTVLDNLRIGSPDAPLERVVKAAQLAEADEFITALPNGYLTHVGEAAARLSGGERQRLAIARALVKSAPFLVMDEPTSSLDPASEAAIARVLRRLTGERTLLVIAHRLRTIRQADRILVLNRGRLLQEGTHETLSVTSGLYGRLLRYVEVEVA
jgi:thiol reductant ABC exporter CydD subunit